MREIYIKPIVQITYMAEDDILVSSGEVSNVGDGTGDGYIDDPFDD